MWKSLNMHQYESLRVLFLINSELLDAPSGEDRRYKCVSRSHFMPFHSRVSSKIERSDKKKKKLLKPESSLMKCQTLKSVILFWHSLSRCRKTGQVTK